MVNVLFEEAIYAESCGDFVAATEKFTQAIGHDLVRMAKQFAMVHHICALNGGKVGDELD